jgi:7,8-dihydropterin-6-yl-methyl-4-(beta-D-ribofuranosyl)aminobenzene 5'-phosphate synthase
MKITVLIENTKRDTSDDLIAEHGLSLSISFNGREIIFDTGASDSFSKNAITLGIDLRTIQVAVLSHHHYDHGGGLARFFELNANAEVYLRKAPDGDCYFKALFFKKRYIGLDKHLFEAYPNRFNYVEKFTEILPNVYIFTEIGNTYPKPKGNRYLYLKRNSDWKLDDFEHELIMAIEEKDKLVIFTGCSHNGMLNMIETVVKKFQGIPVKTVIGGFHMIGLPRFNTMADSRRNVKDIARQVLSYPFQDIYTGHCTGRKSYGILKDVFGEKLKHLHTGDIIEI